MLLGPLLSLFGKRKLRLLLHKANKGIDTLGDLLESGKVVAIIDKCFPFDQTIEALKYYGDGNARGKVVVSMRDGGVTE